MFQPTQVITAVNQALQAEPIAGMAHEPQAHCISHDFKDSYGYGLYAVRYWLTDLAIDAPTDSTVHTRIYFALRCSGIPPSIPAQSVFLTQESRQRKRLKYEEDIAHRLQALTGVELFHSLNRGRAQDVSRALASSTVYQGRSRRTPGRCSTQSLYPHPRHR